MAELMAGRGKTVKNQGNPRTGRARPPPARWLRLGTGDEYEPRGRTVEAGGSHFGDIVKLNKLRRAYAPGLPTVLAACLVKKQIEAGLIEYHIIQRSGDVHNVRNFGSRLTCPAANSSLGAGLVVNGDLRIFRYRIQIGGAAPFPEALVSNLTPYFSVAHIEDVRNADVQARANRESKVRHLVTHDLNIGDLVVEDVFFGREPPQRRSLDVFDRPENPHI